MYATASMGRQGKTECKRRVFVGFDVLTALIIKNSIFWDTSPPPPPPPPPALKADPYP
jgi:hypothetical protein